MAGVLQLNDILKHPHLFGRALGYKDLDVIHSKWIKYLWFSKNERVIQAHRGAYKTSALTVVGTLLYLIFNPGHRILICRKDQTGATSVLNEISKHLKGTFIKGIYKHFFKHDLSLPVDSASRIVLSCKPTITKEPSIMGVGIGGTVTGFHFERIITDDIVTLKDRVSTAERERTKYFYSELRNLINPGEPILNVGTPWHKDDCFSIMPKAEAYPIGTTGLKTFTAEHVNHLKETIPPDLFSINYLLKHSTPKSKIFSNPNFAKLPDRWAPVGHLDKAYSGKDSVALTLMGLHEGKLYAIGFLWNDSIINLYHEIKNKWAFYKCGSIWSENNDDKELASNVLREMGVPVKTYHEDQNKHVKIQGYLYKHWKNIYWSHDTDDDYIAQVIEYEEGAKHDDAPDSASSLLKKQNFYQTNSIDFYT